MKTAVQVLAVVLFVGAGACRQGPTLDLGDDRRTTGGSGGTRDAAASEEAGAGARGPIDGGAPADSGAPQCRLDSECERERPRCEEGTCIQCLTAADCSDAEHPFCVAGECEECEGDGCEEEQECVAGEDCETCAGNIDCTDSERPICDGKHCVECTADEHCASSEHGFCDVTEGHCE